MRHIYIGLPTYNDLNPFTAHAILAESHIWASRGIEVSFFPLVGFADLCYCRAVLLSMFLQSGATDFVQLDYDIVWDRGDLVKLCDYEKDFVAGVYPTRCDPIEYQVNYIDRPNLRHDETGELIEVATVPGGFLRLKRGAILKMIAAYPELKFHDKRSPTGISYALYHHLLKDEQLYGEDNSFCMRWREIGGEIWVQPDINFQHVGKKHFKGNFGEWLRGGCWRHNGKEIDQGGSKLPQRPSGKDLWELYNVRSP